jgi:hypothetical protein
MAVTMWEGSSWQIYTRRYGVTFGENDKFLRAYSVSHLFFFFNCNKYFFFLNIRAVSSTGEQSMDFDAAISL